MRICPLADFVLVNPIQRNEKTEGGIIVPPTSVEEVLRKGRIVAMGEMCGQDYEDKKARFAIDDEVLFQAPYAKEQEIKVGDCKLMLIPERAILAVVS